jgi:hypothetical protein
MYRKNIVPENNESSTLSITAGSDCRNPIKQKQGYFQDQANIKLFSGTKNTGQSFRKKVYLI